MNETTFQADGKVAYVPVVVSTKAPKLTNADIIRSMTDEELAIWTAHMAICTGCPAKNINTASPCKGLYSGCKRNWLDWLRQEVER